MGTKVQNVLMLTSGFSKVRLLFFRVRIAAITRVVYVGYCSAKVELLITCFNF